MKTQTRLVMNSDITVWNCIESPHPSIHMTRDDLIDSALTRIESTLTRSVRRLVLEELVDQVVKAGQAEWIAKGRREGLSHAISITMPGMTTQTDDLVDSYLAMIEDSLTRARKRMALEALAKECVEVGYDKAIKHLEQRRDSMTSLSVGWQVTMRAALHDAVTVLKEVRDNKP